MTTLAHAGHWYHVLLYLAPILIVIAGLWYAGRRMPDEDVLPEEQDDLLDAPAERP